MSARFKNIFNSSDNNSSPVLDEIISKTKGVAETVGRKSAEGIDVSRKKIESLDTKTKLSKAYEKFGMLQYKIYNGEEADIVEFEEIAGEIRVLTEKLDALNVELEDAKATFNGTVSSVVQKTRDAFSKTDSSEASDTEVEVDADAVESSDAKE